MSRLTVHGVARCLWSGLAGEFRSSNGRVTLKDGSAFFDGELGARRVTTRSGRQVVLSYLAGVPYSQRKLRGTVEVPMLLYYHEYAFFQRERQLETGLVIWTDNPAADDWDHHRRYLAELRFRVGAAISKAQTSWSRDRKRELLAMVERMIATIDELPQEDVA